MLDLPEGKKLQLIEIDRESVGYLNVHFPTLKSNIIVGDFLHINIEKELGNHIGIIGNFPYNISSQIFFKVLENPDLVAEVVCMLQKEVAIRLCSKTGKKDYGILSVFLQAFYDMEYLFTVNEHVFDPPPKVKSGVIRLKRNTRKELPCDKTLFYRVVKQGFNNRRKTLRNALRPLELSQTLTSDKVFDLRAEQLSVEDFFKLTNDVAIDFASKGRDISKINIAVNNNEDTESLS